MADTKRETLDSVLTFIFLKKLMTPITKMPAYKKGLVDNTGKVIKTPETPDERASLTLLDKFMFKMKRLLGSKRTQLNNFLFLQTLSNDFYNKLVVRGSVEQRAEIKRLQRDIDKIAEANNTTVDGILYTLLHENIRDNWENNHG